MGDRRISLKRMEELELSMELYIRCECMPKEERTRIYCSTCRWMEGKIAKTMPYSDPRLHTEENPYPFTTIHARCLCMTEDPCMPQSKEYFCTDCKKMEGFLTMTPCDFTRIKTRNGHHSSNISSPTLGWTGHKNGSSSVREILRTPPSSPAPRSASPSPERELLRTPSPAPRPASPPPVQHRPPPAPPSTPSLYPESPRPSMATSPNVVTETIPATQTVHRSRPLLSMTIENRGIVHVHNYPEPLLHGTTRRGEQRPRFRRNYQRRQRRRRQNRGRYFQQ
jgi:hypothetical protein